MFLCDVDKRDNYLNSGDSILSLLGKTLGSDPLFVSHQWLINSPEKRMIYSHMYGDVLAGKRGSTLDVGGGFCSITNKMISNGNYYLLDIMAHDNHEDLRNIEKNCGKNFWINSDWNLFELNQDYDLIVANDLFPNVDQRLDAFIEKYLPYCKELRLSLTYYDNDRSYKVKRVDADEIFYMLAWDGIRLQRTLEKFKDRIDDYDPKLFDNKSSSIFSNGRKVCVLNVRGDK
jgi:hypothetical protein